MEEEENEEFSFRFCLLVGESLHIHKFNKKVRSKVLVCYSESSLFRLRTKGRVDSMSRLDFVSCVDSTSRLVGEKKDRRAISRVIQS